MYALIFINAQLGLITRAFRFSDLYSSRTMRFCKHFVHNPALGENGLSHRTPNPRSRIKLMSLDAKSFNNFIFASFTFLLNYKHTETLLDYTPTLRSGIKYSNPQTSLYPTYSTRYLWYSWSNFISTLRCLANSRYQIFVLASPRLHLLTQALGWYTYGGSYLN
jgi:hypothetical protein